MIHRVYLIPGFFGFSDLGGITYFHHVERILAARLERVGVPFAISAVATQPTASIRMRTRILAETIEATSQPSDPLILVGHSAGGLDARLLASPGVALETTRQIEGIAARIRAVITLATPHRGTPLASYFSTLSGEKVMFALSLLTIYVLRFGRVPLRFVALLARGLTRLDDLVGLENTVVDEMYEKLLSDFTPARRDVIRAFLEQVRQERGIVQQLGPHGIDLFNASVSRRPGVDYLSVVTVAPSPTARSFLHLARNPYALAQHALYAALYRIVGGADAKDLPPPDPASAHRIRATLGRDLLVSDSDGIVPSRSQVFGEVIRAVVADHHDVVGHFQDANTRPPHIDWIASGSRFERPAFDSLWNEIADRIAVVAGQPPMERASSFPSRL